MKEGREGGGSTIANTDDSLGGGLDEVEEGGDLCCCEDALTVDVEDVEQ